MTQQETLALYLIQGNRTNKIQAYRDWGWSEVSKVIALLKTKGWKFHQRRIQTLNGMGEKVLCEEYWMKEKPKERVWVRSEWTSIERHDTSLAVTS